MIERNPAEEGIQAARQDVQRSKDRIPSIRTLRLNEAARSMREATEALWHASELLGEVGEDSLAADVMDLTDDEVAPRALVVGDLL